MKKNVLRGRLQLPGDKSISHRALIFAALSEGKIIIENCSNSADCASSAACVRELGLQVKNFNPSTNRLENVEQVFVQSPGVFALKPPSAVLEAGNSGTTLRLISGLVAGQPFATRLSGDKSLQRRPMARVINPLLQMGAKVQSLDNYQHEKKSPSYTKDNMPVEITAPYQIQGGELIGQFFKLNHASAQIQAALALAGVQATGYTTICLPQTVRDHTVRLLQQMGAPLLVQNTHTITIEKIKKPLPAYSVKVPGDISSAAFFLVAASLLPGSQIELVNIGVNPGRILILKALLAMGADITLTNQQFFGGEPVANLTVRYAGRLSGITVNNTTIATGIDEIPILSLAATLSKGSCLIQDATELKHKESDRLHAIIENLKAAGAEITILKHGFLIKGSTTLPGGSFWKTYGDHRLCMTGAIAQMISEEPITLEETESIAISYPDFFRDLHSLL